MTFFASSRVSTVRSCLVRFFFASCAIRSSLVLILLVSTMTTMLSISFSSYFPGRFDRLVCDLLVCHSLPAPRRLSWRRRRSSSGNNFGTRRRKRVEIRSSGFVQPILSPSSYRSISIDRSNESTVSQNDSKQALQSFSLCYTAELRSEH